jgi:peptidoglycan/LPS O-acetylase OafA/YrhL
MKRIPTLDGWRGIAILLVLIDHVLQAELKGRQPAWTGTGQHGVTVFFVLSGFLITSRLLENPINLKQFYIRRFFRLMPVAWTYLAVILLLQWRLRLSLISFSEVSKCLLFCRNYYGDMGGVQLGFHFWSLSLEEQFYLVWPVVLLLAGVRRARWVAAVGILGVAAWRYTHWAVYDSGGTFVFRTEVRADALLCGCLLALLLADGRIRLFVVRWSRVWWAPALAAFAFCFTRFHTLPPLYESVCITALIASSTLHPASLLARPLSFQALVRLGAISYSIYVWQQLFLSIHGPLMLLSVCVLMPLTILGSYEYLELPLIRVGHRLTGRNVRILSTAHS